MANPKILSYTERGIKLENVNEGVPINIFVKDGIPLAIKIDQDTQYIKYKIKIEFLKKDEDFVKKEVLKNKEVFSLFNTMKKSMFSSDTIVYCFYKDGKIFVYDCMTNTNFFPFCDIVKIAYDKRYNYSVYDKDEVGFIPMKPILSGYKSSKEILNFFDKYLKEHKDIKVSDLFIMPAFPDFSSTTYKFLDEDLKNSSLSEEKEFDIDEILKEMGVDSLPDDIEILETVETDPPLTDATKYEGLGIDKDTEYTLSYIRKYIDDNKILINNIEETLIMTVASLWTIWSKRENMDQVFNKMIMLYGSVTAAGTTIRRFPFDTFSRIFFELWIEKEKDVIDKLTIAQRSAFSVHLLNKILIDEYLFYVEAFHTAYGNRFGSTWIKMDLPIHTVKTVK